MLIKVDRFSKNYDSISPYIFTNVVAGFHTLYIRDIENDCGETLRCNFFGWFDDLGFFRNFDYDCVPNLEIMAAREVVKNRILEEKETAEQMRLEKVADVNRLFNEGRESGEARLEGRRRVL